MHWSPRASAAPSLVRYGGAASGPTYGTASLADSSAHGSTVCALEQEASPTEAPATSKNPIVLLAQTSDMTSLRFDGAVDDPRQRTGRVSRGRRFSVCCRTTTRDLHSQLHDRAQSARPSRPSRRGRTRDHVAAGATETVRAARVSGAGHRRLSPSRYARRHVLARPGPVRRPSCAKEYALSFA